MNETSLPQLTKSISRPSPVVYIGLVRQNGLLERKCHHLVTGWWWLVEPFGCSNVAIAVEGR